MAKKNKFHKSGKGNGTSGKNQVLKEKPVYCNFFYMTDQTPEAADLYKIITTDAVKSAQIWDDAQVIEVELGDKKSIDIEKMTYDFRDEEDLAYMKAHKIQTVYTIETESSCVPEMTSVFRMITEKLGGFVCSDSTDFEPVICGQQEAVIS